MTGDGLKILDQKRPADIVGLSLFQTGPEGSKMGQKGQPDCLRSFGARFGLQKFCFSRFVALDVRIPNM